MNLLLCDFYHLYIFRFMQTWRSVTLDCETQCSFAKYTVEENLLPIYIAPNNTLLVEHFYIRSSKSRIG